MFLQKIDPVLKFGFSLHDAVSGFLTKYLKHVKFGLLSIAHLSLAGFLFPQISQSYGELARNILIILLLVSPLSKIFRMRLLLQIMALRRELGILFGYLAIVHGAGYMLDPDWFGVFIADHISQPLSIYPRYLFGIIALLLTLPLLVTSNTISVKILKGNWKRLHWLTYPMLLFVTLHNFYPQRPGAFGELIGLAQTVIILGGYILLKLLARNNFIGPLRAANKYVSQKYEEYVRGAIA